MICLVQSGRSTPMSEVTDSAPEEDGDFDDSAAPKWTISGLKDATGQCVLQIHRNWRWPTSDKMDYRN